MAAAGERRSRKKTLGALPQWDLSDLYPGRDTPELKRALDESEAEAKSFQARYQGKLAALPGAALGAAIATYERLQETLGRVMSYASLVHATDMSDPEIGRFYQTTHERVNDIETQLLFFALELNRVEDGALQEKLGDPALARYAPWLRDVRTFRPHQLSDELERLLHEKSVAGRAAWMRLFDETEAALRFRINGKTLTSAEALHLLSDRNPATRKATAKALGEVFGKNAPLFSLITNTLAKDKEVEDRWRGFKRPISSRNLSNFVEDEVVDALIGAVRDALPPL